jgi:hypothetical protein
MTIFFLSPWLRSEAARKTCVQKQKPTGRNLSAVGQERNQMELGGQLNEPVFPMPEDTCAQR